MFDAFFVVLNGIQANACSAHGVQPMCMQHSTESNFLLHDVCKRVPCCTDSTQQQSHVQPAMTTLYDVQCTEASLRSR